MSRKTIPVTNASICEKLVLELAVSYNFALADFEPMTSSLASSWKYRPQLKRLRRAPADMIVAIGYLVYLDQVSSFTAFLSG